MADERSQSPWSQPSPIARSFDWPSLLARDGDPDGLHRISAKKHIGAFARMRWVDCRLAVSRHRSD